MTPADNMPDFDSMSPEEIQVWLESLAKRQGASEGFLTDADMEVAEIDPDTVVIDEPGYVPFGETAPPRPAPPAAPPPPVRAAAPPPPTLPPEPIIEPEPLDQDEIATVASGTSDAGALAWLESLAADQSDSLFNLDITNIEVEDEYIEDEDVEQETPTLTNPAAWLEDLARSEGVGETPTTVPTSSASQPPADSLNWLESLAKRQGAPDDELLTSADIDIPEPDASEVESEEYTPFTFDSPLTPRGAAVMPPPAAYDEATSDPASWLESLAAEQGYSELGVTETQPDELDYSIDGIRAAIEAGTVTPEQMQVYLANQAEIAAEQEAEAERLAQMSADEPPVPADIPDWLLEGVEPVAPAEPVVDNKPPIESLFDEPASDEPDMPEWLKEDVEQEATSIESIFAQTGTMPRVTVKEDEEDIPMPLDIDPDDPWVEAFDLEHEQGTIDISQVPAWYQQNVSDPNRIANVERMAGDAEQAEPVSEVEEPAPTPVPLMEALLPDEELLPEGEPQDIPRWLSYSLPSDGVAEAEVAEADILTEADLGEDVIEPAEVPDWLREVEADITPEEIPDWLVDAIEHEEPAQAQVFEETRPTVIPAPPPPAPKATPSVPLPASAELESARTYLRDGDLEHGLAEYEALVRSNRDIDAVVDDLSAAVRQHRDKPALYRVLGDGYMRQGKLQQALDTYREALNQL